MLEREETAGAADTGLHLVADEERAGRAAGGLRSLEVAGRRQVHALALDRLYDERRHIATVQLAPQRLNVAERDSHAIVQKRAESVAELRVAVERKRPQRQPVEGVLGVKDPRATGGRARQLDRCLDRFRTAVGGDHRRDPRRRARHELLGEHARQEGDAELGEAGGLCVECLAQRFHDGRMAAPHGEHAVAAEQIEIALAGGVDQMRALTVAPIAIEAERAHDPPELAIEIAVVEAERLTRALLEDLADRRRRVRHCTTAYSAIVEGLVVVLHLLPLRKQIWS